MEFQGLYVSLRKIEPEDRECVCQWMASSEFKKYLYSFDSLISSDSNQEFDSFLCENADEFSPNKFFLVESKRLGRPIGLSMMRNIDWKNGTVEHNYIIGDRNVKGGVYGVDISISVACYLFQVLNLNKIIGYTYSNNEIALSLNARISEREGVLRQHYLYNGKYLDVVIFGLTKNRFIQVLEENKNGLLRKHFREGIIS